MIDVVFILRETLKIIIKQILNKNTKLYAIMFKVINRRIGFDANN